MGTGGRRGKRKRSGKASLQVLTQESRYDWQRKHKCKGKCRGKEEVRNGAKKEKKNQREKINI
jgi:hypothetical protein